MQIWKLPGRGRPRSGTQPGTGPAQAGRAGKEAAAQGAGLHAGVGARDMTFAATTQEEEK